MTRLAIIGSRTFADYELLRQTIGRYFDDSAVGLLVDEVISGGAAGADKLAERWVAETNAAFASYGRAERIKLTVFKPDWETHGKRAGFLRNEDIIAAADVVLCMWDGVSRGSANSLSIAKRLKKPTLIVYF